MPDVVVGASLGCPLVRSILQRRGGGCLERTMTDKICSEEELNLQRKRWRLLQREGVEAASDMTMTQDALKISKRMK